ncbi:MAG: pyridoxamine 5'-phosphate oxidase, partial [Planctomycetota bacterium]
GVPSVRAVLLKDFDPSRGAVTFYTNYDSRKGREIDQNPRVALAIHWDRLERQVRLEGDAARAPAARSDEYFSTRPRLHQIGAWASDQSRLLASQHQLRLRAATTAMRFVGRPVPRPSHWGGYVVTLDRIEFWRSQAGRIHRRVSFDRDGVQSPWRGTWLYP